MYIFDWDENKNQTNQSKHGIDFIEASSVFYDEKAILLGMSETAKVCVGDRDIC